MLVTPYLTVAEFRRAPTFMDSSHLVARGSDVDQDATLENILITASQWVDDKIDMPLAAHTHTEHVRLTPDRTGRLRYHPERAPVIDITGLAFGASPDELDAVTAPQTWIEHGGRVVIAFGPSGGTGLASLQFGVAPAGGELLTRWTYIAGYPATQLAEAATAGAAAIEVRDVTGIRAGTVLRIWTPGKEEAVTVAAVVDQTLTLSGALRYDQTAGATCSALPTSIRQAVVHYTTHLLLRPAATAEEPASRTLGPAQSASAGDSRRTGRSAYHYDEACKLLKPYKRIR